MSRLPGRSPPEKRERCPPHPPHPPPAPEVRLVHGGEGTGWASLSPEWPGRGGPEWRGAEGAGGGGRCPGTQGHLGVGGGASRRPGRGQSPDRRAALPGLSSGTTQVRFRSGGAQGAWRPGRSGVPPSRDAAAGGKRAPTGKGAGPRVPGGRRARGEGRAPGLLGGRARERGAGSAAPSGQAAARGQPARLRAGERVRAGGRPRKGQVKG